MELHARIRKEGDQVRAECVDRVAPCRAVGSTEQEALSKLTDEVLFYLEKCPCSTMPDDSVHFIVVP